MKRARPSTSWVAGCALLVAFGVAAAFSIDGDDPVVVGGLAIGLAAMAAGLAQVLRSTIAVPGSQFDDASVIIDRWDFLGPLVLAEAERRRSERERFYEGRHSEPSGRVAEVWVTRAEADIAFLTLLDEQVGVVLIERLFDLAAEIDPAYRLGGSQ